MNELIFKGIWAVLGIIMLRFYAKRKHTIISAAAGMISGSAALILLHFFGSSIGFAPQLNLFNTMVSLILGIPGVIMMAGIKFLF